MLHQIITMSLKGNHEYNTRSKDTVNADTPELLSALSKVEFNLKSDFHPSKKIVLFASMKAL